MTTHKRQTMWIALVSLMCCCPVWGKTWTVGKQGTPCPNANYNTVTAAINAAQAGDIINICPALYAEQLVIAKPLTLRGIAEQGVGRAVIQPAQMMVDAMGYTAVISVVNTAGVTISNLAIDAANNTISGCTMRLAGIHFYNASGTVDRDAISGARLADNTTCTALAPGNGFGVLVDRDANATPSFKVTVQDTSIHDFSRSGILAIGAGVAVDIHGNSIAGVGPASGGNQFGVFLISGVTGQVIGNHITQGSCGTIPIVTITSTPSQPSDCRDLRSEGVVLRSVGDGFLVAGNTISNVQAGIFVNGFTLSPSVIKNARVVNNVISNVEAWDAIHIQGVVSSVFTGNRIFHVGPFTGDSSAREEGCGINDVSGTNSSGNNISENWINDAYCGVSYVTGDRVEENVYLSTLYETLNGDNYPNEFPPPLEPGQAPSANPSQAIVLRRLQRKVW